MNKRLQLLAISVLFLYGSSVGVATTNKAVQLRVAASGKAGFTLLAPEKTGISFTNTLSDRASAENRVLNNGSGVAAGDYDNDGWTDLFFCSLNNKNRLFRNLGDWRFVDVTAEAGLKFSSGYYRAAVFADLNGDGWLDLLVGSVGNGILCFLNDGNKRFTNATAYAGTASPHATESIALADVDGNGTLDLYVTSNRNEDIRDWPRIPIVMVNKKPTVPPALRDRLTFESGQLQEYGEPDIFYLNDGRARFTRVPWTGGNFLDEQDTPLAKAPLDWGLTAAFRDLNDDGAPDLYVCNDYWTADRIWLNTGDGRFRAIAQQAIRKICASSMGVDFSDINRDGHVDIFVVDMLSRSAELRKRQIIAKRPIPPIIGDTQSRVQTPQNTLLLNRGDGTYAEIACLAGVEASDWSWSPVFVDVDLDGYEDLLITAGHIRDIQDLDATERIRALGDSWRRSASTTNLEKAFIEAKREHTKLYPHLDMPVVAFRNLGNLRFEETTADWGLDQPAVNHGIAMADFDRDGDLDVAVNRLGAPAAIYRNESPAPRVAVRVHGQPPNTQAIGARIELLGGPVPNQKTEVTSGGSYLSGHDTLRVFAAGNKPSALRITWRNGSVTEITNVRPNHLYEITEASAHPLSPSDGERARERGPLFEDVSALLNHTHHEEAFDDFARQPLLPRKLSQNGPGVAWVDLDGDGWQDLLVGSGKGGKLGAYLNKQGKRFEAISQPAFDKPVARDLTGVVTFRRSDGVTVLCGSASYEDGDTNAPCIAGALVFPGHTSSVGPLALAEVEGHLTLFAGGQVVPGRYPEAASSLLFRQIEGQWQLDVTNSRALASVGLVNGAVWSDLTADGLPELILACEWGPLKIFRHEHGKLVPWNPSITLHASRSTLDGLTGWWTGVATGDFDGDGQLDILAGNWGFNSIEEASPQRPLVLFHGDLAGADRVDILETEWDALRKQYTPRLQRESLTAALPFVLERFRTHTAYSRATVDEVLGERTRHAKKLSVTTLATTLFLNRGGSFEARELPVEAQAAPVFGVQVADMDGDGHEDAFLSQNFFAFAREESRCDAGRGLWLRGDGRGQFAPVPSHVSGVKAYGEQRGAALADFDQDGRVDLVVTQNGAHTRLYRNTAARPGLRVRLIGPMHNVDGIGAAVRLRYGAAWGPAREIHAGSGYWSQDSLVPVLGVAQTPTAIWARWPGGEATETPIPPGATEVVVRAPKL